MSENLLTLVVLLAAAAPLAAQAAPTPASAPEVEIGQRCLDCHAAIVRSYRSTGMAHALGPIEDPHLADLASVPDANSGFRYRFAAAVSGPSIVESWTPPSTSAAGAPAAQKPGVESSAPLAFAIGAGRLDQAYAAKLGDLLFLAPLEVVGSGAARRATLAPGHMIQPGTRFTIPITEECLACHTDDLMPREYPLNLVPRKAVWKPAGISCAACHGPVDAHAIWREAALAGEKPATPDPVLTATRTGPIESLSVCARCHLQGDARILLEPGARGIPPPGGDLLARCAVFVAKNPTHEIGFVSQVERLALSRCFIRSFDRSSEKGARALTCVTCHDPHRSSTDAAERKSVRDACSRCHAEGAADDKGGAGSAGGCALKMDRRADKDCVQCHMRLTGTFDVAAVLIHDHKIERKPPPASMPSTLRTKEARDGELALFAWPGEESRAYAADPGLWMMALMSLGRPELALPFAMKDPGAVSKRLSMYYHLRGSLYEQAEKPEAARQAYERALLLDPSQAETTVNLAPLLGRLGEPQEGVRMLSRLLARYPKAEGALRNRCALDLALHDEAAFAADLEAAQRILPRAPNARALAQYYARLGRADVAEHWRAEALRLDPTQRSSR
jgi:predicted CXXCH cytochrome family protein